MNTATQLLGDLQKFVQRWEQQILKDGGEERTTAPVTKADGNEKRGGEIRSAVLAEAKSTKPGINLGK